VFVEEFKEIAHHIEVQIFGDTPLVPCHIPFAFPFSHFPQVFVEKFIEKAHHIEVQIFGDGQGNVVHLGERECSIQRRHQKVLEETPSPLLNDVDREALAAAAVRLGEAAKYR
jgi:acetyl/propionyl-CoA carboxylase alpha subunit